MANMSTPRKSKADLEREITDAIHRDEGNRDEGSHALADRIASAHGCDILPRASGGAEIVVRGYWQQGGLRDQDRIRECRAALKAAGVLPWGGYPLETMREPAPIRIAPVPAIAPVPMPWRRRG